MSAIRSAFPFCLATVIGLFAAGVGAAGPDPGLNVTVTNTPANPVPVAGSLGVTGNVTVNNTQANPVPVSVVSSAANPVPVTVVGAKVTHMGVPVSDHVTLNWASSGSTTACGSSGDAFFRVLPDGQVESAPFVVPAGRSLVVTDMDAVVIAGAGQTFPQGRVVQAVLTLASKFNTGVFMSHLSKGVVMTDATTGAVAVSSTLGAGFVVGAGQQICVRGDIRGAAGGFGFADVDTAAVRGYLM